MLDATLKNAAILIVDDQEANVQVLERLLAREGYSNLRSITDSRQTLARLAEFQPDLILLDLLMPYIDGFAVLEQLRQVIPADSYLPILVLTADITPEARLRALASGAKDFLTKPIDVVETLLRLKNLLEARYLHLQLQRQNEVLEARVRERTADLARANADLTQANVELWQSEVRNQAILNAIPDVMFRIHRDGTFLDFHATRLDDLYAPAESFLGQKVSEVLPTPTAELFTQAAERALRLGEIEILEYRLEIQGRPRDYEARVIANGENEVLLMARDITERKQAEAARRESQERFRRSFELGLIGMAITLPNQGLLEVNDKLCEILGYDRRDLLQKTWAELTHPDDLAADVAQFNQVMAGALDSYTLDKRFVRQDGQIIYATISVSCLRRADGAVDYFVGLLQDVTERVRAEERSRRETARTAALLRTANRLNAQLDLEGVLKAVCEETTSALEVPAVVVTLYDEQHHVFEVVADVGLPRTYREQASPTPRALYDTYTQQMGPLIVIPDIQAVPGLPDPNLYRTLNMRTVVSASLVRDQQLVGTLALITFKEMQHFTDEALDLLNGLAAQAAQAITNARLFAETETRLEHLRSLREIDRAIVGSLDVRLTLKVFLDQTIRQLRVDAADVLLMNAASQTLTYGAGQGFRTRAMEQASVRLGESFAGQVALERRRLAIADIRGMPGQPIFTRFVANEAFVAYCGVPLLAKGQLIGVLEVYQRTPLNPSEEWLNFLETLAGQAAIAVDNARLFSDLQHSNLQLTLAYDDTIEGWSRALDLRDKETEGHSQRVTDLTLRLARGMKFDEVELVQVRRGALLHDIGKMGIPDDILLKPGKLTDEEWVIMKKHPVYAYDLLSPISFLRPALDIPYCHHEKWDGTGYPRQLKGEAIPLSARLFAIVDVWDALRSDRPYRAGWPEDKVLTHIQSLTGAHFEPRVVEAFLQLIREDQASA